MPVEKEAQNAILKLNGVLLGRKKIVVTGMSYFDVHLYKNF
jgi:hypothetical protein